MNKPSTIMYAILIVFDIVLSFIKFERDLKLKI